MLELGDMTVVGLHWPPKMLKALAAVAQHLHPAVDALPDSVPGYSKETCVFCSLAVRDYLVQIGFADATVRGCGVVMRSTDMTGKEIHSLGIGVPGDPDRPFKFNGHAVVTVPSLRLLIDTTLYPTIRPAWGGALTGMFACDYDEPSDLKVYDRFVFAGGEIPLADRRFGIVWLDRPELRWKQSLDYRVRSERRRAVTRALVEAFGVWND